ncbi:MAG: exodeoxyribonuclease V subunit alpha [Candidatus Cyclonatronum sp.]|uniref:exodeoxyribonuclease V subunit alpha n=1 Tax=Cyclonatronum sp. TaxID=3024185 RepID=UPI0025BA51BF|nr:exodeoxyribonuclease V subunit alpha [Cyclonatronum sp.]MCH8486954.1 exodeoxyribonuclease V subunit alpha [Cyclonatronum sp.]
MQQELFNASQAAGMPPEDSGTGAGSLDVIEAAGIVEPVDRALMAFFRRKGETQEDVLAAVALLSAANRMGHTALSLPDFRTEPNALFSMPGREVQGLERITLDENRLRDSAVVHVQQGDEQPHLPLVLDGGRLYFNRYFQFEQQTARQLLALTESLSGADTDEDSEANLRSLTDELFGSSAEGLWQRAAGVAALNRRLTVLTGGPGTGKTYTVLRLLLLLLKSAPGGRRLRVAIAAPTGKAANRVRESLIAGIDQLKTAGLEVRFPDVGELISQIPVQTMTLHRLLGTLHQQVTFRHNRRNPLPFDLVIVDEASMIPSALMARMLEALRADARLILLGDKHQLASVESGAVFADICHEPELNRFSAGFAASAARLGIELPPESVAAQEEPVPPLRDCIVELTHSRRFSAESGIGQLARAVNEGDADAAMALLKSGREDVIWLDQPSGRWLGSILPELRQQLSHYRDAALDPAAKLDAMEAFQVLCAHRRGPGGVEELNRQIEQKLGLEPERGSWYEGRPVIMTRNDYQLGLFNGDLGVTVTQGQAAADGTPLLRVAMEAFDAAKSEKGVSLRSPAQLHMMETCWALSVHRSQGSEYRKVLLALPPQDSPVLTRELIYTAVTRAKSVIYVAGSEALLRKAIARRTRRFSGLAERLSRIL